jgi:Holliday junction resolvasome RuvABC endonuclease subunit
MKSILALDLGTKTGYAWTNPFGLLSPGTWTLGTNAEIKTWGLNRMRRRLDPRITRLFDAIDPLCFDIVIFEDVQFSSTTLQTQLWASLRAAVWLAAAKRSPVPVVECVNTSTLKKFATGHGGATKEMMAASLFRLYPNFKSANLDDNAIDALWLHRWAEKHLCQTK